MAESLSLKQIISKVNKKQESKVMTSGVEDLTGYSTLSLGSPSLDFCMYNRFPEKRIIEISGAEGSGKTTLAYIIAGSYIKKELERNPDSPRSVLFVDLECTADPYWANKMGYDMNREDLSTIRFAPEDMSAEEIFNIIIDCIKSGEVGFVVLDSLNMLVPQLVFDEGLEKKDMGGIAKVLGDFVRRITGLLVKYSCTFIGINQLRENIGGYGPAEITSGGRGWKHGCSVRLRVKKGEFFDEEGNTLKSSAESPAGYVMELGVLKSKVSRWDRKLGRCSVSYTQGIDILQDTIDMGIYFGLIDNSVQGTFKLIDLDTGEVMLDDQGNELKIRGKKNLKPYFLEHLDIYRKLYDLVYEKLSKTDDDNIVSFEKMLNLNIAEHLGILSFDEEE